MWWIKPVKKIGKCGLKINCQKFEKNIQIDCWHYVPTECSAADIDTWSNKKVKFNETQWFKREAKLPDIDIILSTLLRM